MKSHFDFKIFQKVCIIIIQYNNTEQLDLHDTKRNKIDTGNNKLSPFFKQTQIMS